MGDLITTAEARQFLRLGTQAEDGLIALLVAAAEEYVAEQCRVGFRVAERVEVHDGGLPRLIPFRLPIVAVSRVEDLHYDAEEQTAGDDYRVVGNRVEAGRSGDHPALWGKGVGRWRVTYTGGYNDGDAEPKPEGSVAAPSGLKLVVLDFVSRAWLARGGITSTTAGNWSQSFGALAGSDVMARLRHYRLGDWW